MERVYASVAYMNDKNLLFPKLGPHYSTVFGTFLDVDVSIPLLQPGGLTLNYTVHSSLRNLSFNIPNKEIEQGRPPGRFCYQL